MAGAGYRVCVCIEMWFFVPRLLELLKFYCAMQCKYSAVKSCWKVMVQLIVEDAVTLSIVLSCVSVDWNVIVKDLLAMLWAIFKRWSCAKTSVLGEPMLQPQGMLLPPSLCTIPPCCTFVAWHDAQLYCVTACWVAVYRHTYAKLWRPFTALSRYQAKASDRLESFLSKIAFESDFQKKTCTCVMKTFAISSFERNFHD